jgi:hypothetical protein
MLDAYLDIETTGLSWQDSEITVVGVYLDKGHENLPPPKNWIPKRVEAYKE